MLNMIGMDFVWKINTIVKREGRGGRLRYNYLWNIIIIYGKGQKEMRRNNCR